MLSSQEFSKEDLEWTYEIYVGEVLEKDPKYSFLTTKVIRVATTPQNILLVDTGHGKSNLR